MYNIFPDFLKFSSENFSFLQQKISRNRKNSEVPRPGVRLTSVAAPAKAGCAAAYQPADTGSFSLSGPRTRSCLLYTSLCQPLFPFSLPNRRWNDENADCENMVWEAIIYRIACFFSYAPLTNSSFRSKIVYANY